MPDTICALATPPGVSGLAVIRLSGDEAIAIADKCFVGKHKLEIVQSHTIHYGSFQYNNETIDMVTAAVFVKPNSYTGENVVEISCHGGINIYNRIIQALTEAGARHALAGEFTQRAFINGRLDLTQAEAVADLIHGESAIGALTAARQLTGSFTEKLEQLRTTLVDITSLTELELDFSDEDIEFADKTELLNRIDKVISFCNELISSYKASQIARTGYYVTIIGYPNSGKSTLFNSLLQKKRSIVSDIPGTTRDYIEETIFIGNIPVKLIDTAGIRETDNVIEIEGIQLVDSLIEQSNMIIVMNDLTKGEHFSDNLLKTVKEKYPDRDYITVQNKLDLVACSDITQIENNRVKIYLSAKLKVGIDKLLLNIRIISESNIERLKDVLINQRQYLLLKEIVNCLEKAKESSNNNKGNEITSFELRNAITKIGEITGKVWNEDILHNIFSKFCIGK